MLCARGTASVVADEREGGERGGGGGGGGGGIKKRVRAEQRRAHFNPRPGAEEQRLKKAHCTRTHLLQFAVA